MAAAANEERKNNLGYWGGSYQKGAEYILSDGAEHGKELFKITSKRISSDQIMVEGKEYISTVESYFSFLEVEFGMEIIEEKKRGNAFYDVQYSDKVKIVSISYENIEDYLQVIVFLLENGRIPDYDDKTKTLHQNHLNNLVMSRVSKNEIGLNAQYFSKYNPNNELERKLLKGAKELRLCLQHFDQLRII